MLCDSLAGLGDFLGAGLRAVIKPSVSGL